MATSTAKMLAAMESLRNQTKRDFQVDLVINAASARLKVELASAARRAEWSLFRVPLRMGHEAYVVRRLDEHGWIGSGLLEACDALHRANHWAEVNCRAGRAVSLETIPSIPQERRTGEPHRLKKAASGPSSYVLARGQVVESVDLHNIVKEYRWAILTRCDMQPIVTDTLTTAQTNELKDLVPGGLRTAMENFYEDLNALAEPGAQFASRHGVRIETALRASARGALGTGLKNAATRAASYAALRQIGTDVTPNSPSPLAVSTTEQLAEKDALAAREKSFIYLRDQPRSSNKASPLPIPWDPLALSVETCNSFGNHSLGNQETANSATAATAATANMSLNQHERETVEDALGTLKTCKLQTIAVTKLPKGIRILLFVEMDGPMYMGAYEYQSQAGIAVLVTDSGFESDFVTPIGIDDIYAEASSSSDDERTYDEFLRDTASNAASPSSTNKQPPNGVHCALDEERSPLESMDKEEVA
ncbi:uncharacterized protein EV422DRAFT_566780 [Fimicolochytrium jonesii]|uniref:uncharacterized protein n=1 Tax=Fimicolochytrium jonesii TaxID=1396493 RepID=UPI0022FF3676|nr:uncharacterized protein EV422DRAFT_566780 [Fimicolochytrium jonesii]KAI8821699.1 hypothetical protein EV422DRAFT_566780 [Fimicolochytrium jonesii]